VSSSQAPSYARLKSISIARLAVFACPSPGLADAARLADAALHNVMKG